MKVNNDNCGSPVNNLIYDSTSCFDAMGRDIKNASSIGTSGESIFAGKFNDIIGLFNLDIGDNSLTVSSNPTNKTIEYSVRISSSVGNGLSLNPDGLFAASGSGGITALTGNVTASGSGSVVATIANSAVTYAKMQNVSATDRLLGRVSAGSGSVEEVILDTDGTLAADSDDRVTSQKAVKTYVDSYKSKFSKSSSDQSTATGALVNVTDLLLSIGASETVYFRAVIHVGTSATNGARWAVTIPASATMKVAFMGTTSATVGQGPSQWLTTSGTETTTVNAINSSTQIVTFEGWVTTGATSGNIQIQGRTVNAANTVTFYSGSFISGHKI